MVESYFEWVSCVFFVLGIFFACANLFILDRILFLTGLALLFFSVGLIYFITCIYDGRWALIDLGCVFGDRDIMVYLALLAPRLILCCALKRREKSIV